MEFETNLSFSLRTGLAKINEASGLTLGAGINPVSWLQADYAFQMHSELSSVHRISITVFY